MKKIIVCGAFVLGVLALGGQMAAQACEGTCKPKTTKPAPAPAPDAGE